MLVNEGIVASLLTGTASNKTAELWHIWNREIHHQVIRQVEDGAAGHPLSSN